MTKQQTWSKARAARAGGLLSSVHSLKHMNTKNRVPRTLLIAAIVALLPASQQLRAQEPIRVQTVNETQTSWVPRVITNVIEVRIPTNIFINVYRTNLIEAVRSNVVNVYRTNWTDRTETRVVPVELTRTNFITRYETNVQTLTFTNFETVLVMKTNRVTQQVPSVVEIDAPATASRSGSPPVAEPAAPAGTVATAENLTLDTTTLGSVTIDDLIEVRFRLKSAEGATPKLAAYEWRVERTDGSVLLFGQEAEFKRELPLGTYRVEVRTRATPSSPPLRVRSVVEVTDGAVVQQRASLGASAR